MQKQTKAFLLINLGTPEAPTPEKVGPYLKEFLMDPQVVDIPWVFRWFFVNTLIVPRRKYASAEAYKKIWNDNGSPLFFHTHELFTKLKEKLKNVGDVYFAMRYGQPSIRSILKTLASKNYDQITVIPLYPQYALSSTQSSIDECECWIQKYKIKSEIKYVRHFYDYEPFIESFAEVIRETVDVDSLDCLVMSFHGLPARHLTKLDVTRELCYQKKNCCEKITEVNQDCYRAQCFATARALAKKLGLAEKNYTVTFQSRLGRTEWIQPYTDIVIQQLSEQGLKKIAVVCPSFVSDCLETLEEIGMRAKEDFEQKGGELIFVPCINSRETWVKGLEGLLRSDLESE